MDPFDPKVLAGGGAAAIIAVLLVAGAAKDAARGFLLRTKWAGIGAFAGWPAVTAGIQLAAEKLGYNFQEILQKVSFEQLTELFK